MNEKRVVKNDTINIPAAVFIDGNWLYTTTRRINKDIDYNKFLDVLIKKFGEKTEVHYFGTIDPVNKKQQKFYFSLTKAGYIIHCSEVKKVKGKIIGSSVDVNLALNTVRILPLLEKFILVSGDSDFVPLLQYARQIRVDTFVIAIPISTGYSLKKAADIFINLEALFIENKKENNKTQLKIQGFEDQDYIKEGDRYNSYLKLKYLMQDARRSIVIIDPYIDDQILSMFALLSQKISKAVITEKKKIASLVDFFIQVKKLEKDGHIIKIYDDKKFHDRYIGIDDIWWHSGHSFKDLGEKNSMLNKVTKVNSQKISDEVNEIVNKK